MANFFKHKPLRTLLRTLWRALTGGGASSLLVLVLAVGHAEHPPRAGLGARSCESELALALQVNSIAAQQRSAEVTERRRILDLTRLGLSSAVSVQPSYSGERNLAKPERPTDWGAGLNLDANIRYRHDAVAELRAEGALHKAEQRYRDQRRADVLTALLSFSQLRVAERAAATAEQNATDAEEAAAQAQAAASSDASPQAALDLREAQLTARRARRNAEMSRKEVGGRLNALIDLGVLPLATGDSPTAPVCRNPPRLPLEVPLAKLESNDTFIALLLALELAEAQASRAAFAPLHDLAMSARYQQDGTRTTVQVGLDGGRPEASVEFRYRDVATYGWSVGISATLRVDESMGAELRAAKNVAATAAAELAAFEANFAVALTEATATLADAYEELGFAGEALTIAAERATLAETEKDRARAAQAHLRALDGYERAYQTYLRAVNNHLANFGMAWGDLGER